MCGFGDKDRRFLSPPPCVRLRIVDTVIGAEMTDIASVDVSFYALLVELWSVDETTDLSLIPSNAKSVTSSAARTRNLIGSLVATAFKLYDLNDTLGIWFILQDLSVRTEGEYKLKFSFVNLEPVAELQNPPLYTSAPIISYTFSRPFRSYSAKKFPGVIDTTELSRYFAMQGIRIPIRRHQKNKSAEKDDPNKQQQQQQQQQQQ
jgi:hypothetical protein